MDVGQYLRRISYDGPVEPTVEVLRAVQWAHLEKVPFEDLDIHAGLGIRLEEPWLFQKIVVRRRGGLCFELNGSFAALLEAMGFEVVRLSARVFMEDGSLTPELDHLVLLVTLRERWLADVGFGECFRVPLRLDDCEVQKDGYGAYRLEPGAQGAIVVHQRLPGRDWEARYQLTRISHHQN